MYQILDRLKMMRNRDSTRQNYLVIWQSFNKFVMRLDIIPSKWEDRIYLFMAHLVHKGRKSTTIRSYYSALKSILTDINYKLKDEEVELRAITRACKFNNDRFQPRLAIRIHLLEMILFEIEREFECQPYLKAMYQALFAMAYYGLFRIGEIVDGSHTMQARNVYFAQNKSKILIVLYTSKTHDVNSRPQKIKISALEQQPKTLNKKFRHFCPFELFNKYLKLRGTEYDEITEHFFIFQGKQPVDQDIVRAVLAKMIEKVGLDPRIYTFQGMHAGHATDLHLWGFSLEEIKDIGHWKSNAIYKYIKD